MIPRRLTLALLALLAVLTVPGAAHAAAPPGSVQWQVANAGSVQNGVEYQLSNTSKGAGRLGYDNRTFGVDLGWNKGSSGGHFVFLRDPGKPNVRDHRRSPLAEDQRVAIYNTKTRRYLRFEKRGQWKAELEWDRSPKYEWQLHGQQGAKFAVFNGRVKQYLVHQFKNYGINLGWLQTGPPATQSFSVPLAAQPVVQGWIPYLGTFGGGVSGTLQSVQNASQSATLLFVKPGRKTQDCGDPAATVPLAPRATMTAEQRKTLYGSETPRLPITFLACVTTPTPQSISLTHVNITYRLDG